MNFSKRRTSYIWEYFRPTYNDKASCNICKLSFSYKTSTSNLKRHIDRKHPGVLERDPLISEGGTEMSKTNVLDITEQDLVGENIVIEYFDDSNANEENTLGSKAETGTKQDALTPKILRIPISRKNPPLEKPPEKPQPKRVGKEELNSKFSNLADSRTELLKIEIAAAKKDLELKEMQLLYAKREDERRQKEHEIILKIKEAELRAVLNQT